MSDIFQGVRNKESLQSNHEKEWGRAQPTEGGAGQKQTKNEHKRYLNQLSVQAEVSLLNAARSQLRAVSFHTVLQ